MLPAAVGVAALGSLLAWLVATHPGFVPTACAGAEAYLPAEVVGQDLAVRQLADAVCTHLAARPAGRAPGAGRPLVISAHGPPGVGKTLSHQLLARALYNAAPSERLQCPGKDCRGYKVFYGMDYLVSERAPRLSALRDALLAHLRAFPEALLVVEEYDKLDCDARGLWRQLLQHPERANVTWDRAVVVLESNLGMSELEQLLTTTGRNNVTAEQAERSLRELVFSHWQRSPCESYDDTLKFTSLVDFWLPFFPLERPHVEELTGRELARRGRDLAAAKGLALAWDAGVVAFLADKVEFVGPYPMEGAKGVESAVTRHVARLLRHAPPQPRPPAKQGDARQRGRGGGGGSGGGGSSGGSGGGAAAPAPAAALVLAVGPDGRELTAAVRAMGEREVEEWGRGQQHAGGHAPHGQQQQQHQQQRASAGGHALAPS
ncbi:hypothetical protein Rsub_05880 [Raphidocelis subcapitata]|uniref:AAA+ ATPase domain-containing protein n=1 Tax=Raphidocelis subcapitata TaxID=307507 RepID=A0A2V0P0P6_9CHLO|nr:hypothetical protein Rsub_05880 [Raphidocelis subcapitata]|eukprot:GBF93149.1 hypothetical protein Rsub_05880 [Raphidocelis subcapitata]